MSELEHDDEQQVISPESPDIREIFLTLLEADRFSEASALIECLVNNEMLPTAVARDRCRRHLEALIYLGKVEAGMITMRDAIKAIGPDYDFPDSLRVRYNQLLTRSRTEQQQEQMRKQAERLSAVAATSSNEVSHVEPAEAAVENGVVAAEKSEPQEDLQAAERASVWPACHELINAITQGREPPTLPFDEGISVVLTDVVRTWFIEKGFWNKLKPPVKFAGNLVAVLGALLERGLDTFMTTEELVSATGIEKRAIQSVTNVNTGDYLVRHTPWEIRGASGKYKLVFRGQGGST